MIFSARVHRDDRHSRGVFRLLDEMSMDSGNLRELVGAGAKGIGSHRATKKCGDAGAGGGDRLVEAFASGAGAEFSYDLIARSWKIFHIKCEVLIKTADD